MGLDMYLTAKRYFSPIDSGDKELAKNIALISDAPSNVKINEICGEAGYWRKANAIHGWFVTNVQHDQDDCKKYYVSRKQLSQLKADCQSVLDNPDLAEKLLPTTKGFFFGGTDYDIHYFEDLKYTIEVIHQCLAMSGEWTFEYNASW